MDTRPLLRALISVSDKTSLDTLAHTLQAYNVRMISTGGSANALREYGYASSEVSSYTSFPEVMNGRVKTLHPIIFGGVLMDRDNRQHMGQAEQNAIREIDLVVVNLYPFAQTIASGAPIADCIENIDIGGPSLLRAAAKNSAHVCVLCDPDDYPEFIAELKHNDGAISLETRRRLAKKAYRVTAQYDHMISQWWDETFDDDGQIAPPKVAGRLQNLRYGENPHQSAALHAVRGASGGIAKAKIHQGKPLSFNNLLDADAAWRLINMIDDPAVVIVKHAMPCCCAIGKDVKDAYQRALQGDPVSAFGGIVALNRPISAAFAKATKDLFLEVIIAPQVDDDALEILQARPNLRVLTQKCEEDTAEVMMRSISGGVLIQQDDTAPPSTPEIVSNAKPTPAMLDDMNFAWIVARFARSNAIVLAHKGICVGIGQGQTSRIDALHQAIEKAEKHSGCKDAVLASDGFIPFFDVVKAAANAGIKAIIQPGGAKRDDEVLTHADNAKLVMAYTGVRHFRH